MEKLKFYIDEEKLNKYEKENKKISYKTLINYLFNNNLILCNNITKLFYQDINGEYIEPSLEVGKDYDEENDYYKNIYQYFIVDFDDFNLDFMKKYCQNEIILYYIDFLDCYILGVDHFGTGWNYVLTDFEYTTEYEGSMQNLLYN